MKRIVCLILTLVMLLGIVGCGEKPVDKPDDPNPGTEVTGDPSAMPAVTAIDANTKFQKEIVVAQYGDLPVMDTMGSNDIIYGSVFMMVFERLVHQNKTTNELEPELAKSWEISPDGLTYTFYLEENAKFHNGDPVLASDVVYTFNRAKEQSSASAKVASVASVEALDEHTVKITLSAPNADFMYNISYQTLSILSEKAVTADPVKGLMVGCGPYILTEWVSGDHCTVVRNDDYYGQKGYTEKFTFKVMTEASARLIALQSGDVDICLNPDKVELNIVRDDKNIELLQVKGVKMYYIVMNTTKAPFNDVRVRQAIALVTEKDDMIAVAAEGLASVAHTFFPPEMDPYTCEDYDAYYPTDYEKAKQLLADAGYPNGFEIEFLARDAARVLQAQILAESLKKIGITMKITQCDTAAMRSAIKDKSYDICGYNWSNSLAPDMSCSDLFATGKGDNNSHFSEPWFDETAQKALATSDIAERAELYHQLQEFVMERVPLIPLYYENMYIAVDKHLENFALDNCNLNDYTYCYIVEG